MDSPPDNIIFGFNGQFRFLSNFWPVRHGIFLSKVRYPTVEHAYQAAKTLDPAERAAIERAASPGEAKALGRSVTLRPDWEEVHKLLSMEGLLRQKFKRGSYLAGQLKATGDAKIVEANTWGDTFWGRCRGKGHNHLGNILMEIRDDLNLNLK